MQRIPPQLRDLSANERELIDALLSQNFRGQQELKAQAAQASLRAQDHGGALVFAFTFADRVVSVDCPVRIPVEAEGSDADGMPIHFLLHVIDGIAKEVEVFREDGNPILQVPLAKSLKFQVNCT